MIFRGQRGVNSIRVMLRRRPASRNTAPPYLLFFFGKVQLNLFHSGIEPLFPDLPISVSTDETM